MRFLAPSRTKSGFTLVELVMTIVLLGVLSIVVAPRFFDIASFDEATYRDSVVSVLSLARQRAIASRRYVCVTVTAGTGASAGISLSLDPAAPESISSSLSCSLALPVTGYPQCDSGVACPKPATIGSASFAYDPQGRPVDPSSRAALSANPAVSITISNQQSVTAVTVQARSGYAS